MYKLYDKKPLLIGFRFFLNFICLIFLCNPSIGFAQSSAGNYVPTVIPPSPTAASLGMYGDIQVGYYTGTINPTVPLYTIKTAHNNLDIKLSYLSTGLVVSQDASWVGLGWSLQAGGVITKSIRGKEDGYGNDGPTYLSSFPSSVSGAYCCSTNANQAAIDLPYFKGIFAGSMDGEPDTYYFNFGNYSGKFNFKILPDGDKVYECNKSNLQIRIAKDQNGIAYGWVVTDPSGYVYYFATKESSNTYSNSIINPGDLSQIENSEVNGVSGYTENPISNTDSWYLDSIASPSGEKIHFQYTVSRNQSLSLPSRLYKQFDANGPFTPVHTTCTNIAFPQPSILYFAASRQAIYDVYLSKITFDNGYITFHTSDRTDIQSMTSVNPQKVDGMSVYDLNNNLLKHFNFYQSYFDPSASTYDYKRLKLDSVGIFGSAGRVSSYTFTYADPTNLPSKLSKAQDDWGYYNGASDTQSLLPPTASSSGTTPTYLTGGNRNPSLDVSVVDKGILTAMSYPTGGKSVFDYELSDCGNGPPIYQSVDAEAQSNPYSGINTPRTFTLSSQTNVAISLEVAGPTDNTIAYGTLTSGGQTIKTFFSDDNSYANMVLPAGTYTVSVINIAYILQINISWNVLSTQNPVGGGVRILRITNYDPTNIASVKKYKYTNLNSTTSSGLIVSSPVFSYPGTVTQQVSCDDGTTAEGATQYTARESASVLPLGFNSQSNSVSYGRVVELQGENGENGYTEYFYNERMDYTGGGLYPGIPLNSFPDNGQLTLKRVYDKNNNLLSSSAYTYTLLASDTVQGIKIEMAPFSWNLFENAQFPSLVGNPYEWGPTIRFYNNLSQWWVLSSDIETTYHGSKSFVVTKNMSYDNPLNLQLTREAITESDGKTMTSLTTYPDDYSFGTTFLDNMKSSHLTGMPIEKVQYQFDGTNTQILSGQINQYKPGGKGVIDQIFKLETNTPIASGSFKFSDRVMGQLPYTTTTTAAYAADSHYVNRLNYNMVDALGNPLMITPSSGVPISYQWGYNRQYPVAQATNAPSNDIFYDSFEEGDGYSTSGDAKTGHYSHTGPYSKSITGLDNGTYTLSYWQKTGTTWSLQSSSVTVSSGSYTISLSTQVDDIRLYPSTAQMTTYTYDPLIGMTSSTDPKGQVTYYEYDSFQRLMNIKDQNGNIVKHMDYHYQGQ